MVPGWQALPNRLEHLVADHLGPAQPLEDCLVLRRIDEIVDLVPVRLEVVKFLGWFGFPEVGLRRLEFAFVIKLLPHARRRGLKHVVNILPVNQVRHVLPDVNVALVAHGADQVVTLIHAATEAKQIRLGRRGERVSSWP